MTAKPTLHVAVFGATGKIGRLVVDQLLAGGHTVAGYARNPDKIDTNRPGLTVIQGGLDDPAAISEAVTGADAVISALGPALKRGATGTPVTDGTHHIVAAMATDGVRRYIGLATPAVNDPRDEPTLKAKVIGFMPRLMFPNALTEITAMTEAVTSSDLDWTIARITNPTDNAATGTTRSGFLGVDKVGFATTRADIAAFLVGQLTDDTYVRAAPAISN
ncbi:MAG: NAD(P)H-binding protein [Microthrixaceae bacterium]|nr:NAD(P)H-binding protein [Microthrixaceae bacterium]